MKKTSFIVILLLLFFFTADSQIPPGYYDPAIGKTGEALQQALHEIVQTNISLDYSSVWTCFETTDKRTDGKVWDIYSDIAGAAPPYSFEFGADQCGSSGGGWEEDMCYDREHSWPKSWFGGAAYPMYSDLFILYPTDSYVNGRRSNYPYGTVDQPQWTSMNGSKLGYCSFPGYSGKVFEPVDEFKGDLARTYFYVSVRYYREDTHWPGSAMVNGSRLEKWALVMMLQWNLLDPVSQKETGRNNAIYHFQGNRNPFIDHPEYADIIWGNGTGVEDDRQLQLRVYPNPAHDYCCLVLPPGFCHGSYTADIISVLGKMVKIPIHERNNILVLGTDPLQAGVYFILLAGAGNPGIYFGKMVRD